MKSFHECCGAGLLTVGLAVAALTTSACSNGGAAGTPETQSGALHRPTLPPSPIVFTFVSVDYTNASLTEVTGINDNNGIIGTYQSSPSSNFESFTASAPSYNSFSEENYDAKSVVMQSTAHGNTTASGTTREAGWAVNPDGQEPGTYGLVHDPNSNWVTLRKDEEGQYCVFMQLFGINEYGVAVGYFQATTMGMSCTPYDLLYFNASHSYQYNITTGPPASDNPVITGINNYADVVGYMQPAGQPKEGWYMLCSDRGGDTAAGCTAGYDTYVPFSLTGETVLNGINDSEEVAGTVMTGAVHQGFIENVITGSSSLQYVNASNGVNASTFLNGINDNNYVCGWYTVGGVNYQGFVGIPNVAPRKVHRR